MYLIRLARIATILDNKGLYSCANIIDEIIKKSKKKRKKKVIRQAPKGWWDKMKKEIKKGNSDYSEKRINETIGNIWFNNLSNSKRAEIYKRYRETKSPNK